MNIKANNFFTQSRINDYLICVRRTFNKVPDKKKQIVRRKYAECTWNSADCFLRTKNGKRIIEHITYEKSMHKWSGCVNLSKSVRFALNAMNAVKKNF